MGLPFYFNAPYQGGVAKPGIIYGAWAEVGDEIEWHWSHLPDGSYVSGYTVRRPKPQKESEDKSIENLEV